MQLYQHKVQYYETDKMGIVHHSNYIRWDYAKLEEMGIISPVTAVECKYKNTTTFPDVITINVQVEEFKGVKLKLSYEMKKEDGTLACEARSEHGFLNKDGKLISLKRDYPQIYEALAGQVK